MRRLLALLLIGPLAAASAPVGPKQEPIELALKRARAEARQADARVAQFERAASKARDEAQRLRAEQAAAAEAIAAAEARISAADAESRMIGAAIASRRARLTREQQPLSSLLGGLALMARRPPLLALASETSTDQLVRVRLLLDATAPVIRRRTAALSAELAEGERLERSAATARAALVEGRDELAKRQKAFAALEAKAIRTASATGSAALGAGDEALSAGEDVERLRAEALRSRSAAQLARELGALGAMPTPPGPAAAPRPPLAYRLPADARVLSGLGEVSPNGIRSRGLTLATWRGAPVHVPADGVIRFAGPFRDYDGVVIIDHGRGWMSLLINVAAKPKQGDRVRAGEPLGRALGPLGVELSHNGQHWSPALIAGSSAALSNARKGG